MDEPTTAAGLEHLFEHQDWVRALAVRLSGDAAADDLVQETWLEVLRSDRTPDSPRAWLGGIVRNLARGSRRRDGARVAREKRAAEDERLPSAADLLERAELQRRVLGAVASLDEPYRVVVLLRYAEGLDGEEIASRLGVPGSTVRNRLARALERLRAKLDGQYGERSGWAVLFATPIGDATAQALTIGGGIVKAQLALAAGLVAVATALWWPDSEGAEGTAAPLASSVVPDRTVVEPTRFTDGNGPIEPAAPAAPRAVAASVDRVMLEGRVLGPTTEEFAQATLQVTGSDGVVRPITAGIDGAYSVFGISPGPARAFASLRGFVPFLEDFEVGAQSERMHKDFALQRALVIPVRFTDMAGAPLVLPNGLANLLAAVATRERPAALRGIEGRRPGTFGVGCWRANDVFEALRSKSSAAAGWIEIHEPAPVWVSAVLRERVLDARIVRGDEGELVFALDPTQVLSGLATVVVHVVDGRTGEPVEGAFVDLGFRDSWGSGTKTAADGSVSFANVAPGSRHLQVRAPGKAEVFRVVRIGEAETIDLGAFELFDSAQIRGRVLDPDGHGVAAQVDVIPARTSDRPRALERHVLSPAAADGVFQTPLGEAGAMLAIARHADWSPTVVHFDARAGAEIEIRLVAGTPVELRSGWRTEGEVTHEIRDAAGDPVFAGTAYPSWPVKLRLAPGEYVLRSIRDDAVIGTRTLSIGTTPVVVEL